MDCSRCGQTEPVVKFRVSFNGKPRHKCTICETELRKIARHAPKTAMDAIREKAPRMEYVRRAADKETEKLRKELDALKSIHTTTPANLLPGSNINGNAIACAIFSDWHVEERVDKDKVHGINEYNPSIAKARAHQAFRSLLRLTNIYAEPSHIDTIFMAFIGDFITNYIHEELQETNYMGPAIAASLALQLLVDGVTFLLNNSEYKLIIDCVPGNHGRMTKRPRIANATETSLETFLFQNLANHFAKEPRVEIRVANSKMLYRQFFDKFTMRLIHGDDISYGGGIGGITIPIRKKLAAWDKAMRADLTVMGHFHQLINGGDFIVNGSLIGYNEYAQAIGASPEEPRQCFFLLHNRHGGQLATMSPIWVTE